MRRRGRSVEPNVNSPEQRLVLSVIEQAMQDVVNPRAALAWWEGRKTRDRTRLREEAITSGASRVDGVVRAVRC